VSIFKETIAESIQTQLQARTNVIAGNSSSTINNNNRSNLLPFYLSKNSWVRMTSFVNFTSGKDLTFNGAGNIDVKPDGGYNGNQLSKKYILEGGTLYTKSNNGTNIVEASQRYGIAQKNSVYGGNIDVRANNTVDPQYYQTYGIRPMPGIIDVNMHTKSAYGSLFETTVKFYAWDINQLNELELLFMRPGYSVLLEWGWSQYLDYDDDKLVKKLTSDKIKSQVFNGVTINPFDKLSQQDIYDKLETLRIKYRHNYDGMLGYIKNFSWKMMSNGGYECQTTLISMGEVINSLKISINSNNTKNLTGLNIDDLNTRTYSYDEYENILLSLKFLSETKYFPYLREILYKTKDIDVYAINENEYRGTWKAAENAIEKKDIQAKLKEANFDKYAGYLNNQPLLQNIVNNESKENASEKGKYYEYISLDVWFAIMAAYFNFKTTNTKTTKTDYLIKIIPPKDNTFINDPDLCLAGPDTISVDPSICIVKNSKAFANELSSIDLGDYNNFTGIQPQLTNVNGKKEKFSEFYSDTLKAGYIGNIYVNLSLLLGEYKSIKNNASDDGVNFMTYVNSVLRKISNAMGGLNNFGLSTVGRDQNQIKLVDLYYLEKNAAPKYEFDLMGLGSICRNISIESQIFPEQSTIIAIAAQSRANLGDVYNSTQVYLNAGLTDRIAIEKSQGEEIVNPNGDITDPIYQKMFDFLLYLKDYIIGNPDDNYKIQTETNGTTPYTFLKQFLLRFDGELNFKALIPFKLKITLDGIGGIVVGQIFKVNSNVLPKNYVDKNLGFVVTGISHTLVKNDWETTLETQICILDQNKFYNADGKHILSNKIQRDGFKKFVGEAAKKALLLPIIIDFCEYQALKSLIIGTFYDYTVGNGISSWTTGLSGFEMKDPLSNETVNNIYNIWLSKLKNNRVKEYFNSPIGSGSVQGNGLDAFVNYLNKWIDIELKTASTEKKNKKITPTETYEMVLKSFKIGDTTKNQYANFIFDTQQNILNNADMFWYPLFIGAINSTNKPAPRVRISSGNTTPFPQSQQVFNFNILRTNIVNALLSRNIIDSTLISTYKGLRTDDKTILSAIIPVENKSAWDNGTQSIAIHYSLQEIYFLDPVVNTSNETKIKKKVITGIKSQESLLKDWLKLLTLDITNYNNDARLKTKFLKNLSTTETF
jgi:predicted DNA binding CopG/RHH family protein